MSAGSAATVRARLAWALAPAAVPVTATVTGPGLGRIFLTKVGSEGSG